MESMFKNKKVFVSGGRTGFVGTNLVKALLERGALVYAHSLHPEKRSNFAPRTPNLTQSCGDLSVSAELPQGLDYVFHCAAHTSGAHEMVNNPTTQITANVFMNSLLLDSAAKSGVKKFMFISSSAVYPDSGLSLSEDMGFQGDPPEVYFGPAWMKRYTEKLAQFYSLRYGMEAVIIRPSNIYGPYSGFDLQSAHVLPALIRKFSEKQDPLEVWGSPDVTRDFIYADDFVKGALLAFEKSQGFDVYNIASGRLYTIAEAVDIIKGLTGYSGRVVYNAAKPVTIKSRKLAISKAEERLGFRAVTSLKDGLKQTIAWYASTLKPED